MKRTGPTNPYTQELIQECRKVASQKNINLFRRVADELERATRKKRHINISKINRYSNDEGVVVALGKVLGSGELNKKITVYAFSYSETAKQKITKSGSKALAIRQLIKDYKPGLKIKLIG